MFHKNASFINPLVEKKLTLNQEISDTYCPVYICTTKSTTSLQTTTTTTTSITTNTAATTTTTAKSTTSFTPTTTAISRPIEHEYIYVICFLTLLGRGGAESARTFFKRPFLHEKRGLEVPNFVTFPNSL